MSDDPSERVSADILFGHVEVQRCGDLSRIVAYDRHGVQTIYADWSDGPARFEPPTPKRRRWWQRPLPPQIEGFSSCALKS